MKQQLLILLFMLTGIFSGAQSLNNTKIDGYSAIWFEFSQNTKRAINRG